MIVDALVEKTAGGLISYLVSDKHKNKIRRFQRVEVDARGEKRTGLVVNLISKKEYTLDFSKLGVIHKILDEEAVFTPEQMALAEKLSRFYFRDVSEFVFLMLPGGRRNFPEEPIGQIPEPDDLPLLDFQKQILKEIDRNSSGDAFSGHLIHGITGSGKTRIYRELIRDALNAGNGVIILLPEIALASSIGGIIQKYFPTEGVIYHSGIPRGKKLEAYKKILKGELRLVAGTRSSVFLPVKNLSMIIIDEDQDSSYKESRSPYYHARVVAQLRLENISRTTGNKTKLVLGSATPSVESYYAARIRKKLHYYRIEQRATDMPLPEVTIYERQPDNYEMVSLKLKDAIGRHLAQGNSILLLINRRGHSRVARCVDCRETEKCPHCSVSLFFHKDGTLKCHLCGYQKVFTGRCPYCGGGQNLQGAGTQKIEDYLEENFPGISYARLDHDTSRERGYSQDVLEAVRTGKVRILIGTQMITKGFDLEKVTLMGVVDADIGLNLPDYRSSERVFQMLVQAFGRSGRHRKGEVFVQTSWKDHPVIQYAAAQDYDTFAETELYLRKAAMYPPFTHLIRILGRHTHEAELQMFMEKLRMIISGFENSLELFAPEKKEEDFWEVMGPVPAPLEKINNEYRWHIIIKDENLRWARENLMRVKSQAEKSRSLYPGLFMEIDIDPMDTL